MVIRKLCDLQTGEQCCIVGTLFKRMDLQPSILKEISEEVGSWLYSPSGFPGKPPFATYVIICFCYFSVLAQFAAPACTSQIHQ